MSATPTHGLAHPVPWVARHGDVEHWPGEPACETDEAVFCHGCWQSVPAVDMYAAPEAGGALRCLDCWLRCRARGGMPSGERFVVRGQ